MFGRSKLHYAWIIAAVTFATLLVGGATRASPALLIVPLEGEFQWSRATISFAIGVNILLYGLIGPFAAAMMETFGVRRMMLGALAAIGAGVALTPLMQQSWQLVLLWGVIVGAGTGVIANVLAATIAARWFSERRGLVMGLLTSSAAAGQLLFLPLLAAIIAAYGWRPMSMVLAVIVLVLIYPVAKLMRERPQDVGLTSYGEAPGTVTPPPTRPGNPVRVAFSALGTGLRSRDFWLLAGSFFVCGASTNGLIGTHLVAACSDKGMSEVAAASMLAMMAVFNFVGATGSGWLSDRMDSRVLLSVYYGLRGLSLLYLPHAFDSFYTLGLFMVFYGLDWIATVPPTVRLTANAFGKENTGLMFGWISASHQLGGAAAAYLAGVIRVDLGTYTQAFIISGVLCFVAATMVMFIGRSPSRPAAVGRPARAPAG
jgi:sugar phosphate permease